MALRHGPFAVIARMREPLELRFDSTSQKLFMLGPAARTVKFHVNRAPATPSIPIDPILDAPTLVAAAVSSEVCTTPTLGRTRCVAGVSTRAGILQT